MDLISVLAPAIPIYGRNSKDIFIYVLLRIVLFCNNYIDEILNTETGELAEERAVIASSIGEGEKQPTGRVVGILKRKWRQYCGILKKSDIIQVSNLFFNL